VIMPDENEEPIEESSPSVPPVFTNTPADPRLSVFQGFLVLSKLCIADLIPGHREAVNSVSFSPDGLQFCSGADDGAVCIWNWKGEEEPLSRRFIPDEDRAINVVHWYISSPNGHPLV
jgi:WD40 repeat protein